MSREKRIQIIGLTDVNCAEHDVPGAEHEGCTTVQITFVDRASLEVHQIELDAVYATMGGCSNEDILAYVKRLLHPWNAADLTLEDFNPDPRKYDFDTAWMPLPPRIESSLKSSS